MRSGVCLEKRVTGRINVLVWLVIAALLFSCSRSEESDVDAVLERLDLGQQGPARGICVVAGDRDCALALDLAGKSELLLYVQLERSGDVERARSTAADAGLYGSTIYVEKGSARRVHLADNLADIVVALGQAAAMPQSEAFRVLRPGGLALLGERELTAPPLDGADDWSHPYHGPDNNTQSNDRIVRAPYLTQFLADPRYAPLPQVTVASAGRVFKVFGHVAFKEREEPWLNKLVAFNGYNGTILWTRDLVPGIMIHRNTIVATPTTLYLGNNKACQVIDAATGELQRVIVPPEDAAGGTFWKWLALEDGILYALIGEQEPLDPVERHKRQVHGWPWDKISRGFNIAENPWGFGRTVLAIDPETEKILWSHREEKPIDSRALCMKSGRLFIYRHGAYLACLDTRSGKEIWRRSAQQEERAYFAGPPSSLSVWIESIDRNTGRVVFNGHDAGKPEKPFAWDFGDGSPATGFFPMTHTFPDLNRNYTVRVEAYYEDRPAASKEIAVRFGGISYSRENAPELFETIGIYRNRQGWSTNWRTTCYLKCSDEALYFAGPQMEKLVAVSTDDGTVLWEHGYDNFQLVLRDEGLYGISGPWGTRDSRVFDPLTGTVKASLDIGRRACARPSGSADALFFRAAGGSVRLDVPSGQPQWISPMRAQCHDGVTVANGLLYWWPSVCDCNLTLYGVTCLGPAGDFEFDGMATGEERLDVGGGRKGKVASLPETPADWPAFRANSRCTAVSQAVIPEKCGLLWSGSLPGGVTPTAPSAVGNLVFLGGSDGVVRAFDPTSGEEKWSAFTGGAIRFPPTVHDGRAFVGSGDGWIYAFEARTGRLLWRFRAAPEERRIPVYGKLLSTWPVASSVIAEDGKVFLAAGIANFDGTHLFALDAATGKVLWQNSGSGHLDREARTGVSVQGHLLLHDGKLYLAGGTSVSPAVFDAATGRCLNDPKPLGQCMARASRGWELFLVGDKVVACGRPFYADPKSVVYDGDVHQKMLVAPLGDRDILWLNNQHILCYPTIEQERLSACVADRNKQNWFSYNWGRLDLPGLAPLWTAEFKNSVALAACRNAVVAAGMSEVRALDLENGTLIWKQLLESKPVPWGLAVDRHGRSIVTLENGRILCFGSAE